MSDVINFHFSEYVECEFVTSFLQYTYAHTCLQTHTYTLIYIYIYLYRPFFGCYFVYPILRFST